MARKRITIQLFGATDDKQDVRLDDFIEQLNSVKKALRETELAISGEDEPAIDYKIVDLRHSSPSTVVLEPISLNGHGNSQVLIPKVTQSFASELSMIRRRGKLLIEPELARLRAYQDIGAKEKSRIAKVTIQLGRNKVTIDAKFKRQLDAIVGPDEFSEGSVAGMLETLNFHNTNRFTVYPPLGPKRVVGTFGPELRAKVKEAIGNFVTVFGRLRYKAWSPFPHGINAEDINIHKPDAELPSLTDLHGAFAGSTGNLNSAEFVDKLRHEDW
jgi:hypothetical protein